ncbi:MAG: hypothetical protein K4H23_05250 [Mollicutes bacterium PWAP]|nr:hypothetical protein [Mollicutes bacterium PWAP]
MSRKINGSFKEEHVEINKYTSKILDDYKKQIKINKFFWFILSFLLALINLSILIVASYAIFKIKVKLDNSSNWVGATSWASSNGHSKSEYQTNMIIAVVVASLSIITFLLTVFLGIFQGISRIEFFKIAQHKIEKIVMEWSSNSKEFKNLSDDSCDKLIIQKIKKIIKDVDSKKNKPSIKNTIIKILTGDNYE